MAHRIGISMQLHGSSVRAATHVETTAISGSIPQTPSPRSRQNPTGPQHMKLWAAKEPPVPSSSGSEIGESRPRSVHAKKDQHLGFDWTSHSVVLDVASGWLSCLFLRQEGTRQESANCFRYEVNRGWSFLLTQNAHVCSTVGEKASTMTLNHRRR